MGGNPHRQPTVTMSATMLMPQSIAATRFMPPKYIISRKEFPLFIRQRKLPFPLDAIGPAETPVRLVWCPE